MNVVTAPTNNGDSPQVMFKELHCFLGDLNNFMDTLSCFIITWLCANCDDSAYKSVSSVFGVVRPGNGYGSPITFA